MAEVVDRWHKSYPKPNEAACAEHRATEGKRLVPTKDHGEGKRWQARWRDASGKQRKKNFDKKADAERHAANVAADLSRGVYIDQSAGRVTIESYGLTKWLPAQVHLRPNTRELYESHMHKHVIGLLGSRQIGGMRRSDFKSFVAALGARGLALATIHTIFAVARMVMQSAVDDGLIAANPCSRVPLPRIDPHVLTPLPADAVTALAAAISPRYEVTVWLAAGAGLREGEALGLTVPRVDFLRRKLRVEQQMQNRELCAPKTEASRRTVPLDDVVIEALSQHLAQWPVKKEDDPHQVIVKNRYGKYVQRSGFGDAWRDAVEKAGLPKGTRFHDLRHFYASTLIAGGLHAKTIQARLGHATITETMDTYGHLFPDADDQGRGTLDAVFRPKIAEPSALTVPSTL